MFFGCATTEGTVSAEVEEIPFSKAELEEFLIGKTFPLSKGAFYFENDDKLIAIWDNQVEETTWRATDDSQFCYELKMFGGRECLGLFKKGSDELVRVYEGDKRYLKVSDVKNGKTF